MTSARYAAVVLAGDRGPDDPLARATGAPCKALTPIGGQPLLCRVIATLQGLPALEPIVLVGPKRELLEAESGLAGALEAAGIVWLAPADSPSASAERGLAELPAGQPALVTTADHALLQPAMVEQLLDAGHGYDLAVAMIGYAQVRAAYPQSRRTALRLAPGEGYCGCNLFAVNSAAGRRVVSQWRRVEARRKHPVRMVAGMLGWGAVLRYLLGRLTLDAAFAGLSRRLGAAIGPVLLDQPEAAIDVDSPADLELVEAILAARHPAAAGE